jgi:hypothetical protein
MLEFKINKIQVALQRVLSASERALCVEFLTSGFSINYCVEYFS